MSHASNKICLAVMRGKTMQLPIQIAWQGDAETTFDVMCSKICLEFVNFLRIVRKTANNTIVQK